MHAACHPDGVNCVLPSDSEDKVLNIILKAVHYQCAQECVYCNIGPTAIFIVLPKDTVVSSRLNALSFLLSMLKSVVKIFHPKFEKFQNPKCLVPRLLQKIVYCIRIKELNILHMHFHMEIQYIYKKYFHILGRSRGLICYKKKQQYDSCCIS